MSPITRSKRTSSQPTSSTTSTSTDTKKLTYQQQLVHHQRLQLELEQQRKQPNYVPVVPNPSPPTRFKERLRKGLSSLSPVKERSLKEVEESMMMVINENGAQVGFITGMNQPQPIINGKKMKKDKLKNRVCTHAIMYNDNTDFALD